MTKNTNVFWIAQAVAMGVVAVIHATVAIAPSCYDENLQRFALSQGSTGCFEYWLNRYQTLTGSILTAAVAGITLIWIARQLIASDRQAGVMAAAALRVVVTEFETHRQTLQDLYRKISDNNLRKLDVSKRIPEDIFQSIVDYYLTMEQNVKIIERVYDESCVPEIEKAAIRANEIWRNVGETADECWAFLKSHMNDAHPYLSDDASKQILAMISRFSHHEGSLMITVAKADRRLHTEIRGAWKHIRQLEYRAIGPFWRAA